MCRDLGLTVMLFLVFLPPSLIILIIVIRILLSRIRVSSCRSRRSSVSFVDGSIYNKTKEKLDFVFTKTILIQINCFQLSSSNSIIPPKNINDLYNSNTTR